MYIINISFIVEPDCHDQWQEFIKEKMIPLMRGEGFVEYVFTRVLDENPSPHRIYSLQVDLSDIPQYQSFLKNVMVEYSIAAEQQFGERVLYHTTMLKKIEI